MTDDDLIEEAVNAAYGRKPNGAGEHESVAAEKALENGADTSAEPRQNEGLVRGKTSKLVALSTVAPRAIDWLWNKRIPRGAQTINTGLPGTGKSQQLIDIVAHVTTGADWPDGEPCPCGDVILLSAEDALANTVVPRLMGASADMNRVYTLPLIRVDAKQRAFLLTEDLDELERHLVANPDILLVGIDPVTAFMETGKIDSHKTTDVRGVLGPLSALAEERNVAIYTVTHPPKASTSAINAFVGARRSLLPHAWDT
jgi:RecA-family ATPase